MITDKNGNLVWVPKEEPLDCNTRLAGDLWVRRKYEKVYFVRAADQDDPGTLECVVSLSVLTSVLCSVSPIGEDAGGFGYVYDLLQKGTMLCAGCGNPIPKEARAGQLGGLNRSVCMTCYHAKFKPVFDSLRR